MPIHFGTDGWRAVISDTFTFHNLRLVTQAIADALLAEHRSTGSLNTAQHNLGVVIGYDTRFLSDRYASDAARVLAANGFHVHLAQADCPTPAISFAIPHLKAVAGLMITASHNAPRYNGIKMKASYGGSAPREQCRRVEVYLNDNEERSAAPTKWTSASPEKWASSNASTPSPCTTNTSAPSSTSTPSPKTPSAL